MKRGPKPKKNVSTTWAPELAYGIGLIATDGCLSGDGRHINFTSKDKSLVTVFRHCLKLKNKIGNKGNGSMDEKKYFYTAFSDVNFYQWLIRLGLTPHKSKTIGEIKIPDAFFFDFLRGCYDGDGSMYAYWDTRWRSSFMYYMQFASASTPFLEWLRRTIQRLAHVNGRIKPATRCQQLTYAKKAARILFARMFHHTDIPCLQRKFIKATKIFLTDRTNTHTKKSYP